MNTPRLEMELLRDLNGEVSTLTGWGPGVKAAARSLIRQGFVTPPPDVRITKAGKKHLKIMASFDD